MQTIHFSNLIEYSELLYEAMNLQIHVTVADDILIADGILDHVQPYRGWLFDNFVPSTDDEATAFSDMTCRIIVSYMVRRNIDHFTVQF